VEGWNEVDWPAQNQARVMPADPAPSGEGMRLNRYLAAAGLGSRRGCEILITERRVRINKRQAESPAERVPEGAQVTVDGRPIRASQAVVIALHKPRGVVCTASAQDKRPIITDLMPKSFGRLFTVGRLDAESEGLLLLTNQGDLAQRLAHPKNKVEKEYRVKLDRVPDVGAIKQLEKGVRLEEGMARAERIQLLGGKEVRMVLRQGMKRQIRLMFRCLGFTVERLKRTRIGGLELGQLVPGGWRVLSGYEQRKLEVKT
jgi:23S rRNA pseudouridine2605 synthase